MWISVGAGPRQTPRNLLLAVPIGVVVSRRITVRALRIAQLACISVDRRLLARPLRAEVEHEAGFEGMVQHLVKDSLRPERCCTFSVAQSGGEAGVARQPTGGRVVGVTILPVGREEDLRP